MINLNTLATVTLGTLALTLGVVNTANAEILNFGALKDNTLYEHPSGFFSNGSGSSIFAGRTNRTAGATTSSPASIRRGLIAFDLSDIPVGAIVQNVSLTLHLSNPVQRTTDIELHRLLEDWGEGAENATSNGGGGGTFATLETTATWLHTFAFSADWSTIGGTFEAAVSATQAIDSTNDFYTWNSSQMVADVQLWLTDPTQNAGWILLGDESTTGTAVRFDSRENDSVAEGQSVQPVLAVEYVVPEPSSMVLWTCGLLAISRRRVRRMLAS